MIEALVLADVHAFLLDPGDILDELRPDIAGGEQLASLETDRIALRSVLSEIDEHEKRASYLFTRGSIDETRLDELLAEIEAGRHSVEERLRTIDEQERSVPQPVSEDLPETSPSGRVPAEESSEMLSTRRATWM